MADIEIVVSPDDRHSRIRMVGWQPEVLQSAHVLVAGAGALGNEVLKNLALLSIGSVLIIDFDTVDVTNLSRSVLFREKDVGQKKAEVAARAVQELNPALTVHWFHDDLIWRLGTGVFRRMDIIIGCLDNRAARLSINHRCWMVNKTWIDGGLGGLNGYVSVFQPGNGACYECTFSRADYAALNRRNSCQGISRNFADPTIPTTPTSAALIAALQAQYAVQILHDQQIPTGCRFEFSSALHEITRVRLEENEDCLSHEQAEPLVELAWARADQTTLGELLEAAQQQLGPEAALDLDREIVTSLTCPNCGRSEEQLTPGYRLTEYDVWCRDCKQEMVVDSLHKITPDTPFLDARLAEVGIPPGHIICAQQGTTYCYFELTGDFPEVLVTSENKGDMRTHETA